MRKSVEILKDMDKLKKKVMDLQAQEQIEDAEKAAKDLEDLTKELTIAKAMEAAEAQNFADDFVPIEAPKAKADKKIVNRAFNKLVFGRSMSDDEKQALQSRGIIDVAGTPGQVGATPGKGGYLVPVEQIAELLEFRRQYTALKDQCSVQAVSSNAGNMPSIGQETGKLVQFDELTDINQEDLDFGQIKYSVGDYGDIIPVSNQILADADIDLMSLIGRRFALKSVNAENEKILAALPTNATVITDWKGITKALNVTLDPAISASAKILTNQDGLEWLDELADSEGRPLLTQSLADPSKYVFRGREIIVVSNALLAPAKAIPFYVGSISDAVAFFERQGVEIAVSQDAGFSKNATYIRAVERFGVTAADSAAETYLTVAKA